MKAIQVHAFGGNDAMVLEDVPDPVAGEGEYVVRIRAAGVNPVDWRVVRGHIAQRGMPHALPLVPGWDFAGEVVSRGHAARRFSVGDKVFGYLRRPTVQHGTYAEMQAVPEPYVVAMPARASFVEAAALPLVGLTSLQSLRAAEVSAGERVLVLGASGGTGTMAVQLARILGAEVCGVASAKNHAWVKSLGAAEVYDYAGASASGGIPGVPEGAFDVVYDCVGGVTYAAARRALREGGRAVSITNREPTAAWKDLGDRYRYVFVEPHAPQLAELAGWFDAGRLAVHVDETFPLARAAEAHARSEALHTRGKIVLTMG